MQTAVATFEVGGLVVDCRAATQEDFGTGTPGNGLYGEAARNSEVLEVHCVEREEPDDGVILCGTHQGVTEPAPLTQRQ